MILNIEIINLIYYNNGALYPQRKIEFLKNSILVCFECCFRNDSRKEKHMKNTKKMVGIALLTAIVVVLQFTLSSVKVGTFTFSFVLIPIVVGAALYGYKAGAWLGLAFAVTVLISGDAAPFLAINVPGTIVTVLLKGIMAGLLSGLAYKYFAVIVAAIACPIANTGIFLIGCRVFFFDAISQMADSAGFDSVVVFMFVGLAGINFLIELGTNIVLSPIIVRLINLGKKENI